MFFFFRAIYDDVGVKSSRAKKNSNKKTHLHWSNRQKFSYFERHVKCVFWLFCVFFCFFFVFLCFFFVFCFFFFLGYLFRFLYFFCVFCFFLLITTCTNYFYITCPTKWHGKITWVLQWLKSEWQYPDVTMVSTVKVKGSTKSYCKTERKTKERIKSLNVMRERMTNTHAEPTGRGCNEYNPSKQVISGNHYCYYC